MESDLDLEKIINIHLTKEMKNIYVIGYFGHENLGDETYKVTFNFIFQTFLPKNDLNNYKIHYLDCDTIKLHNFNDTDIIILGGGDILNDYFLDKIILKFRNKPNKIIAVSVGIPYIDIIINTNKLNIIDYIFVRTKQDLDLFKEYFHVHRIFYLPDISYYLLNQVKLTLLNPTIEPKTVSLFKKLDSIKKNKKIIAITLSQHIHSDNLDINVHYNSLVQSINQFVRYLLTFGYHVVFLPFNTNQSLSGTHENDILIHNDIIESIKSNNLNNLDQITNIDFTIDPNIILQLYDYFYITVPMRFHATLFSIYKCIPMLPIFTTRKIKNLLLDINYDYSVELKCNEKDLPIYLDTRLLISQFAQLVDNYDEISSNLNLANRDIFVKELKPLFENTLSCGTNDTTPSLIDLITKDYAKINSDKKISTADTKIQEAYTKAIRLATDHGYTHFTQIKESKLQDICVQIISHTLTNGTLNSIYNYGMKEKLFSGVKPPHDANKYMSLGGVTPEWKWVINDNTRKRYLAQKLYNNPYGLFNINFIDQVDYSGVHRSGWQYVYEKINYLHDNKSELYLDLYLDRTFHWNKEVNKFLNLIPYTKTWIGFVHHTFETGFSDYNCYNMLDNADFIESLKVCKGLFVLSRDLRIKFQKEFFKRGIDVPVFNLMHPTEVPKVNKGEYSSTIPLWDYSQFINNKDKKIINVGAWLRNIFSFYYLNLPNKYTFIHNKSGFPWYKVKVKDNIRKVCLKGGHMNNYFPSLNFTNDLGQFLVLKENNQFSVNPNASSNSSQNASGNSSQNTSANSSQNASGNSSQNCSGNSCQNSSGNASGNASHNVNVGGEIVNNWHRHFHDHMRDIINSVDLINQLTNEQYDDLLTKNIVFINLVDASAVNTVIECIVRNTPIVVNDHPAVKEMLGPNYPLYYTTGIDLYNTNQEIVTLLSNTNNIKKANVYLQKLDKTKYTIEYFIDEFTNIIKGL
jgi:polysaccharide pyruvyl transferase WcaK-like protein